MLRYLKAVYFWTMGVTYTGILFVICVGFRVLHFFTGNDPDGRNIHRVAQWWGRGLVWMTPGWAVEIIGRENIPPESEVVLYVANHESMSDIFAMYFLGTQFRWLAKNEVFLVPVIGRTMRWARYVPVERGKTESHSSAMAQSREILRRGISMFFFPEGTRSTGGVVQEFKLGAFRLASEEKIAIVPVAIHGAAQLLPKGGRIPGRATIQLTVLPKLVAPAEGDATTLNEFAASVRKQIIAAHQALLRADQ